jgi:hypothetical protein
LQSKARLKPAMAHHQSIHPVDLEAGTKLSAPLMPSSFFHSDKGDPRGGPTIAGARPAAICHDPAVGRHQSVATDALKRENT